MFDNLPGNIWLDGNIIPWQEARIHVMTHALHYASSVFEGLRAYQGKLLQSTAHYTRLHQSAKYLDFKIPFTIEELSQATNDLLNMGHDQFGTKPDQSGSKPDQFESKPDQVGTKPYQFGYVRAISWCGSQKMSVSHNGADVHVAISIWERPINYASRVYIEGFRLILSKWRRPHPDTAPVHSKASGLYMIASISKKAAELDGFDDALMLDHQGYIADATSSNIFFSVNNKLYTPKPTCFLNGITRLTCIELATKLGIEVIEGQFTLEDLQQADEVFLTGTAIEILPVGSLDIPSSLKIDNLGILPLAKKFTFKPGGITAAISIAYKNLIGSC